MSPIASKGAKRTVPHCPKLKKDGAKKWQKNVDIKRKKQLHQKQM